MLSCCIERFHHWVQQTLDQSGDVVLCLSADACFLRQDQGSCQNYTMMWFFDTEQNECSRFWFGGCGGNDNRFATQDKCEDLCLSKSR